MSRPESYRERKACANCKHIRDPNNGLYFCELMLAKHLPAYVEPIEPHGICDEWEGEEGDGDE